MIETLLEERPPEDGEAASFTFFLAQLNRLYRASNENSNNSIQNVSQYERHLGRNAPGNGHLLGCTF